MLPPLRRARPRRLVGPKSVEVAASLDPHSSSRSRARPPSRWQDRRPARVASSLFFFRHPSRERCFGPAVVHVDRSIRDIDVAVQPRADEGSHRTVEPWRARRLCEIFRLDRRRPHHSRHSTLISERRGSLERPIAGVLAVVRTHSDYGVLADRKESSTASDLRRKSRGSRWDPLGTNPASGSGVAGSRRDPIASRRDPSLLSYARVSLKVMLRSG